MINNFLSNYLEAYNNGVFDYWSVYGIGYAYLTKQNYKNAIPYLKKSTELKSDYPSSHYNLAFAYLYTDQREHGIKSAKKTLEFTVIPNIRPMLK